LITCGRVAQVSTSSFEQNLSRDCDIYFGPDGIEFRVEILRGVCILSIYFSFFFSFFFALFSSFFLLRFLSFHFTFQSYQTWSRCKYFMRICRYREIDMSSRQDSSEVSCNEYETKTARDGAFNCCIIGYNIDISW
jgi:hypothetical protein